MSLPSTSYSYLKSMYYDQIMHLRNLISELEKELDKFVSEQDAIRRKIISKIEEDIADAERKCLAAIDGFQSVSEKEISSTTEKMKAIMDAAEEVVAIIKRTNLFKEYGEDEQRQR